MAKSAITIKGVTRSVDSMSLKGFDGVNYGADIGIVTSVSKISPSKVMVDTNMGTFDGFLEVDA